MSGVPHSTPDAALLLLLFIVSMIGFAILHLAPGGPLSQFAASGEMTQADLDRIAEQLGLDRPLPVQYLEWLWRMLRGDWGVSYRDQQPVSTSSARISARRWS
jgi:peptide/nickel transport system permease protein